MVAEEKRAGGSLLSPALGHPGATEAAGDRGVHGVILTGHVEL